MLFEVCSARKSAWYPNVEELHQNCRMIHYDAQSQSIFLQNFSRERGAKWFKGVPFAVYPLFAFFPNLLYWFAVEISTFALEQLLNILVPLRYWLSEVCHVRSTFLLLLRATLAKYIQTTLNLGSHLLGIPPGLLETKRCSHCRHFKTPHWYRLLSSSPVTHGFGICREPSSCRLAILRHHLAIYQPLERA